MAKAAPYILEIHTPTAILRTPYTSLMAARVACSALTRRGVQCLVVRGGAQ